MNLKAIYRSIRLNLFAWLRRISLPGFKGVSIYHVINFIIKEAMKDDIVTRANSIAFSFFISMFPALIFLFTLIPLLPFQLDIIAMVEQTLGSFLPENAFNYFMNIIIEVIYIERAGLLSIGFVFALFFSSSGMLTLMYGFDKSYNLTFEHRSWLRKRFVAIALTIIILTMFVISFIMIIFGDILIHRLFDIAHLDVSVELSLKIFQWAIVLFVMYTSISLIYRFGPKMRRRTEWISPGAILATTLSIVTSILFSYFIDNFGRYNELYGSIGALIVLLLWLQINAFILLIGFELNASIAVVNDRYVFKQKQAKI